MKTTKRLAALMESLFDGVEEILFSFVNFCLDLEPFSCFEICLLIEDLKIEMSKMSKYSFEAILLDKLDEKMKESTNQFIKEQLRGIEEQKQMFFTSKKKTDLLSFSKALPLFISFLEQSLKLGAEEASSEMRDGIFSIMEKFTQKVFDSLTAIERELDDKLTSSRILLENDYFLYSNLRPLKIPLLDRFVKDFKNRYESSMEMFTNESVLVALGKISEFSDGIRELCKSYNPEEIIYQSAYSKQSAKKVLSQLGSKDVKKSLEAVHKRLLKQFADESGGLIQVLWRNIQEAYLKKFDSICSTVEMVYKNETLISISKADILNIFTEIK